MKLGQNHGKTTLNVIQTHAECLIDQIMLF